MSIDTSIHAWFTRKWTTQRGQIRFWRLVTHYGIWVVCVLTILAVVTSTEEVVLWPVLFRAGAGVVGAWIVTLGIAYMVRRVRPFHQKGNRALVKMLLETPSFPSGHSSLAFAFATTCAFYANLPMLGYGLCFIAAFAIAYSRLYVGVHYVTDVLCGAFLGVLVVYLVSLV